MRKIIYICDRCKTILSDEDREIAKPHLSIDFGYQSGWVRKDKDHGWKLAGQITGMKQFCNGRCLAIFLNYVKAVGEAKRKPKK